MAGDSLVSAMQSEWGDENSWAHQPVTLKNLITQLKMWLEGAELAHLPSHLAQMKVKVRAAADATQQDLRQPVAPELDQLIRATLQDYLDVESFLEELRRGVLAGDEELVREELAQLRASTRSLSDGHDAIQAWRRSAVLRCPRCGASAQGQESSCFTCGLDLLYPDARGPGTGRTRTLRLGPEFKAVHDAYQGLVKGEQGLGPLQAAAGPLRRLLEGYAHMAEGHLTYDRDLSGSLEVVAGAARDALQGLALLENVPHTRRTRDLHQGWRTIFEAAGVIQEQLPAVARGAGEKLPPSEYEAQDSVWLSD